MSRDGFFLLEGSFEKARDAVIGRSVDADERQAQNSGGVNGSVMIDRQEPALDLADPLSHQLFGDADRDAVPGQKVSLQSHDIIELGQRHPFGVMGDDQVDFVAQVPVEKMSQEHLAHFHVDADKRSSHRRLPLSKEDPGVGEWVEEPVTVEELLFVVAELVVSFLFFGQGPPDLVSLPQVVRDPNLDGQLIKSLQLHGTPPLV